MEDELYEMDDEMDLGFDDDMEMEDGELDEFSWGGAAAGAIKGGFGLDEEMEMEDEEEETIYEIEMDDEDEMGFEEEMMEEEEEVDFEEEMMEEDEMDFEEEMMEEDDDMDSIMEAIKKAITPKGVGIGKGPKFNYDKKPNQNLPVTKQKEAFGKGTKAVGTGKAKFEYKEEKNFGSNKHEYKRKKVDGVEKKAGDDNGHYKTYEKRETKEASRTYGSGRSFGRGLPKPKAAPRHLKEEVIELRTKNDEYRKALDLFRTKLNEVAVFNSNLAYATRLFTEHSTTKQEKINILRRFDDVETLKESKNLYRVVKSELSNNSLNESGSLNESIERTVNKTASSGSAVSLIESKTYENPQFLRMKDLMGKL
jgi:hypothetical protein